MNLTKLLDRIEFSFLAVSLAAALALRSAACYAAVVLAEGSDIFDEKYLNVDV